MRRGKFSVPRWRKKPSAPRTCLQQSAGESLPWEWTWIFRDVDRCANLHTSKNDRPRYQCVVGDIASQTSRFGEALDGSPALDQSIRDDHLRSGNLIRRRFVGGWQ